MAKKGRHRRRPSRHNFGQDATEFFTDLFARLAGQLFQPRRNDTWPRQRQRLVLGALGGTFVAGLKSAIYEGISGIVSVFSPEPGTLWVGAMIGFLSGICVGAAAGAAASWLFAPREPRLQFLTGMLGVTIFVTIIPSLHAPTKRTSLELPFSIQSAHAQITPTLLLQAIASEPCVGPSAFEKGFKTFFGARERYDRYAVVAASGKNAADAQAKLRAITAQDNSLKLKLGPRACDNEFYPIFASDYLPQNDAKAILDKVKKIAPDAYLSPGPRE